jgi:alpha-glucosidase
LDTSFLGFDIHDQPLLGENVGLIGSKTAGGSGYHSLFAEYMQNGSLGRRINVEVRAFDDGIAFRYIIPESGPLREFLLEDEATEFCFANDGQTSSHTRLSHLDENARLPVPFLVEQPDLGWVGITETPSAAYPHMTLARSEDKVLVTRLPQKWGPPSLAFRGATPLTSPWRVILVGASPADLRESRIPSQLPE